MPPKTDETQNIKITKLEDAMIHFEKGLDEIKSDLTKFDDKNDKAHKDITDKIDKFIASADDKYAPKAVIWWIFITIGGFAIVEVLKAVLK